MTSSIPTTPSHLHPHPQKLYNQAAYYTSQLPTQLQLPINNAKQRYIKNLAQGIHTINTDKKNYIKYSISAAKYQNNLFKKLEDIDLQTRLSYSRKLSHRRQTIDINRDRNKKKMITTIDKCHKQLAQFYKKVQQKKCKQKKQNFQHGNQLQQSLLQYFENQKKKNKKINAKPTSACYQEALSRKYKIQQKNQQFSQRSQKQLKLRMARNSAKNHNILLIRKQKSAQNKHKQSVYDINCQINKQKQYQYIQKNCQELCASARAFSYKETISQKNKQRIQKFFKDKMEKIRNQKKKIDQSNSLISQRCTNYMNRSKNAIYRQSISSFRQSTKSWTQKVQQNHQKYRNKIMRIQLDMRLRNTCSFLVEEKMDSMIAKAKILAKDFV